MASLADYAPDERTARVILSMIAEPANVTVGRLLRQEGGIETLRALETADPISGARPEKAAILHHRVQEVISRPGFDDALRGALDGSYQPLIPGDPRWPAPVDDLGDRAPYVLWTRGATSFLAGSSRDRLTITGARASTSYGNQVTSELAQGASLAELIVVSGGAYGIDGAAHRAALSVGGSTIAVMAGSPDHLYPRGHSDMLEQIADTGLLMSELPPGIDADPATLRRPRPTARGVVLVHRDRGSRGTLGRPGCRPRSARPGSRRWRGARSGHQRRQHGHAHAHPRRNRYPHHRPARPADPDEQPGRRGAEPITRTGIWPPAR